MKCLGSSAHYFFCYCDSLSYRRRQSTSEAPDLHVLAKKPSARLFTRSVGHSYSVHIYDGVPRLLRMLCPECLTDWFLAFSQHAPTGQMGQGSHQWVDQGVPWPGMMFGYVYCSERPGGVHLTGSLCCLVSMVV